jgi:isopentenyl-diphosphate delta-isomerase
LFKIVKAFMSNDLVTLVNQQDQVIGEMDKVEAHRGDGKLHRAISVFLFRERNGKKELLIQQRSLKKIVGANQWANTCCGNVRPTENYADCAHRRLREELGISGVLLEETHKLQYQVRCNDEFSENEIDQVYVGPFNGASELNPDEVQAVAWVSWEQIVQSEWRERQNYDFAPWFKIMLQKPDLIKAIADRIEG